jgi:lipopolysaccharide transport system permease protein
MSETLNRLSRYRYLTSGLRELIDSRYMIWGLVKRDLRGRYKGSFAGFLWNYITPVIQILVYILVFSEILRVGIENYYAFLVAGLIPWIFFSESLLDGTGSLLANGDMVKKLYFPRAVIPISIVLSKTVTFSINYVIVIILLLLFNFQLSFSIIALPAAMILLAIFALGLAMLLSPLNVLFRDIQYIVNVLLMAWIWLTPIMYLSSSLNNQLVSGIIQYNPMTYYICTFQSIVYNGQIPDITAWILLLIMSVFTLFIGYAVIKKLQGRISEEL